MILKNLIDMLVWMREYHKPFSDLRSYRQWLVPEMNPLMGYPIPRCHPPKHTYISHIIK